MAKVANQILRLKNLYELFMKHDEEHPLTTEEILNQLGCERQTFYADFKFLKNECHLNLNKKREKGRQLYYYERPKRHLELGEIRYLLDAVQSSAFLTKKQTADLYQTIAALADMEELADIWEQNVIRFDTIKHSNEEVLDTIECIDIALEQHEKISFRYFNLGVNGKRIDKGIRYVNPVGLIFNNGYYYLCGYDDNSKLKTYRLDRIAGAKTEREAIIPSEWGKKFRNGELKDRLSSFGMWNGEPVEVTLRLLNQHAGDIFDKFGEETKLTPDGDGYFRVTVTVNLSDVFLGWCASYGDELKILSPKDAQDALLEKMKAVCSQY